MSKIKYKPYIGKNYENQPLKILILGQSQYNVKEPTDSHTKRLIDGLLDSLSKGHTEYWLRTFRRFTNVFLYSQFKQENKEAKNEDKVAFWESVAFYNYVQRDMEKQGNKPTQKDWEEAYDPFLECLNTLKPDVIYVWGKGFGNKLKGLAKDILSTVSFEDQEIELLNVSNKKVPVKILPHPRSISYSLSPEIATYHKLIKAYLTQG